MFTFYPLKRDNILYNRGIVNKKEVNMAVLRLRGEEMKLFPTILREYANYQVAVRGMSEKTVCEYLLDLRTFFRHYKMTSDGVELEREEFENIDIRYVNEQTVKAIGENDILAFISFCSLSLKNNTSTRMRKLSSIKSFFKFAHTRLHIIDKSPAEYVEAPKKAKTLPKYLTVEESVKLLETIKSDVNSKTVKRDFAIVALFLNTGIRLSELVGLNLTSFDPDIRTMKVVGKGNKERVVYINDSARGAIIDYLKVRLDPKYIITSDKAFFLSKRQTRISIKTVQWMVNRYLDLAGLGLKGLSVHKLRHTAATLMYQSGKVDIRVLQDILGHEQLNTTQIYTHVVNRNLEEAVDNHPLSDVKIKEKIYSFDEE